MKLETIYGKEVYRPDDEVSVVVDGLDYRTAVDLWERAASAVAGPLFPPAFAAAINRYHDISRPENLKATAVVVHSYVCLGDHFVDPQAPLFFCEEEIGKRTFGIVWSTSVQTVLSTSDGDTWSVCIVGEHPLRQAAITDRLQTLTQTEAKAAEPKEACRICGCAETQPCDGGCYWVDDPRGGSLCSKCAKD